MGARVGINGFGRMGRLALRAAWDWPDFAFVHVNELSGDASTAAHLLTFDSIHGRWSEDVAPHKDLRRARAANVSLIPTTTGSATAIGLIFPELEGKLNGLAVRVPLLNASLTDCVFEVARPTTVEEVNGLLETAAAAGPLAGILGYERRPLVSVDFKDDPRSGIVDAPSTIVTDGTQVKILAWYDNEWGYANRLVEIARMVARTLRGEEDGAASPRSRDG
jgi:glyceraldehyde-3-phosphate dehydrogenase/erythrose-4-phosphate dehydrogenase